MSLIFRDREKLTPRYIPQTLPHREGEVSFLSSFYRDVLEYPSRSHLRAVQIVGAVGSGKTAVARLFGERFEAEARKMKVDLKHVYVNMKLHGASKVILYRHLLTLSTAEAGRFLHTVPSRLWGTCVSAFTPSWFRDCLQWVCHHPVNAASVEAAYILLPPYEDSIPTLEPLTPIRSRALLEPSDIRTTSASKTLNITF